MLTKSDVVVRVLRGGNISDDALIFKPDDVMIAKHYVKGKADLDKNCIITPAVSSLENIGKAARIETDYKNVVVGGFVLVLTPHLNDETLSRFLFYTFVSPFNRDNCRSITHKSGQAFYNLSREKLMNLRIPLPPLLEQKRIIEVIDSIQPLVAEYKVFERKLAATDECLPVMLRKSILQHAIQGKLVPQDSTDEPARVLLERIAKERAKLGKKAAKSMSRIERRDRGTFLISPDGSEEDITNEIPFDIPESWEWAQLGSLVELKSGTVQKDSETGILYVKVGDLGLSENEGEIVTSRQRAECAEKDIIPPYSIIFPKRGGAIYTNKKRYILSTKVCVDLNTMAVILPPVLFDYVKLWFELLDLGKIANGSAIPQINNVDIAPLLIPIPPIKEQIRICSAVSEMIQSMKFNA